MSMKALDKLLGRSTIDPTVMEAFEEGRIVDLMGEYSFSSEVLHELRDVEARDFNEFAELAYRIVEKITVLREQIEIPDPMEGLCPERILTEEEQVA